MAKVDVRNEVEIYEVDGKDVGPSINTPKLIVESHWNSDDFVVLSFDGKSVTVHATDLEKAIANATNS